jgi:hypothetical protein
VIRTRLPMPDTEEFIPSDGDVGFYGKAPVPQPAGLTPANSSTVDLVYGAEEQAVIVNLRTRLNEMEARLSAVGLLP